MAVTNLPRVPEGLRELMKVYTKEVLREKPTNLYIFSAQFFETIVRDKLHHPVRKYEPVQSYEIIMRNRIRQQVPLSLVFNIIPDNLTELIKQFIKAVLKENPGNIYIFAKEYFQQLSIAKSTQNELTKYTSYEKYLEGKENLGSAQKVTCECGRILSASDSKVQAELSNTEASTLPSNRNKASSLESHSANYLKAVCIIQKHVRKYLRRKRINAEHKKIKNNYNSREQIIAISLIQRQFRRYLNRKRAPKSIEESSGHQIKHYSSVKYIKAVYVIQHHYRQYRKRQLERLEQDRVSLSAAAFIIQRAFRRLIRARRAKKHTPAALEQGDDVNDNASEAGSYTSASTALLSTESTGEHFELGGYNYEECVHQQTIKEDDEVENDYVNFQEKYFDETVQTENGSLCSKKSGKYLRKLHAHYKWGKKPKKDPEN